MSLDAGGLAQMTYSHNSLNGGLGMPSSGFASRAKGGNIKRLSVAPPSKIATIDENEPTQPRTSRSHLLAGLRTAPRSPAMPNSAPPTQLESPVRHTDSRFASLDKRLSQHQAVPKTATASNFSNNYHNNYNVQSSNRIYTPDQILAPPAIQIGDENGDSQMDPTLYEELVRTNQYLAQQQMRLQQQLINVTAAAQQFQNLNLGQQQQFAVPQGMGFYNQQLHVQPVPNQPGWLLVYNPLTGEAGYYPDPNAQQARNDQVQNPQGNYDLSHSPPPPTPTFRAQVSPPPAESPAPVNSWRSNTPPKSSPSPPREEVNPLPPPSAGAFRPNHRKNLSLANGGNGTPITDGPKTGGLKNGFPQTPMTGTFGPGQAREGEHPTRQPRGPPSLEELVAKPTSKFEGSKNFATRQRRRAVHNLVRAGIERRGVPRDHSSAGSSASGTPTSEKDISFSADADNDSVRSGSASLSGKPSFGNLRSSPISAIGSERAELKERSRERSSIGSELTASTVSSEDGSAIGGKLMEVRADSFNQDRQRRSPLSVLANAEKRRSLVC